MTWIFRRRAASEGGRFRNRTAAGRALAARLSGHLADPSTLVLALPRGGVPVAFEVARGLDAPLDLLLARKLGVPGEEELAMGAVAEGGLQVLNDELVEALAIPPAQIARAAAAAGHEIERQARAYRDDRPTPELRGRTVILVDDGLATGATMRAAVGVARAMGAARVVVAAPVAARETAELLAPLVDELVVVEMPEPFGAIGLWYDDFGPVGDDEVRAILQLAAELRAAGARGPGHDAGRGRPEQRRDARG